MSATGYPERVVSAGNPALFGRVMALVALTVGFATLGVWAGRNTGGAGWFIAWLLALGCLIGLNVANAGGNRALALVLLFAFGLLIGASVATTINYYSTTDPAAVRQAGRQCRGDPACSGHISRRPERVPALLAAVRPLLLRA